MKLLLFLWVLVIRGLQEENYLKVESVFLVLVCIPGGTGIIIGFIISLHFCICCLALDYHDIQHQLILCLARFRPFEFKLLNLFQTTALLKSKSSQFYRKVQKILLTFSDRLQPHIAVISIILLFDHNPDLTLR